LDVPGLNPPYGWSIAGTSWKRVTEGVCEQRCRSLGSEWTRKARYHGPRGWDQSRGPCSRRRHPSHHRRPHALRPRRSGRRAAARQRVRGGGPARPSADARARGRLHAGARSPRSASDPAPDRCHSDAGDNAIFARGPLPRILSGARPTATANERHSPRSRGGCLLAPGAACSRG